MEKKLMVRARAESHLFRIAGRHERHGMRFDDGRARKGPRWRPVLLRTALLFGALLLVVGCLSRRHIVYQELTTRTGFPPRAIAVLPFYAQTGTPALARLVRQGFYGHLSHRPFQDVELDSVDRVLGGEAALPLESLTPAVLRDLGIRLGCDAVVTGTISEFERLFMGVYSQLSVGAVIAIYDTHDGRRLWSDSHVARLHDGGLPLSPLDIPLNGARSGWNLRDSQIVRAVDDLTRTLADRVPGQSAPAATAVWRFELQVGAYLDHQLALAQRDALAARGYPAAVYSEMHQQTVWHRVMVGPYEEEQEALQVRRQLEAQLDSRLFLRRRPL
jgi:hypothetical protein